MSSPQGTAEAQHVERKRVDVAGDNDGGEPMAGCTSQPCPSRGHRIKSPHHQARAPPDVAKPGIHKGSSKGLWVCMGMVVVRGQEGMNGKLFMFTISLFWVISLLLRWRDWIILDPFASVGQAPCTRLKQSP